MSQYDEVFYDRLWQSENWGGKIINTDEEARLQAIIRQIYIHILPSVEKDISLRIVDVGCGRGWLTSVLSAYGSAMGIDSTETSITRARDLYPRCRFFVGDTKALLAAEGAGIADLVVSSEVIEHVPNENKPNFVRDIYSLLVSGGHAILTTPRGELWSSWNKLGKERQPIEEWVTERELETLCREAGFSIISHQRIFLPGFVLNLPTRLLNMRVIRRAMGRILGKEIQKKINDYFGVYQVLLLKKA